MRRRAFAQYATLPFVLSLTSPCTAAAHGFDSLALSYVSDEAEAVLSILGARAQGLDITDDRWSRLFASEGYRRLADRERSMKRSFSDDDFRRFVLQDDLLAHRAALAVTVAHWKTVNVRSSAERALAYLPSGSTLRASVYLEIKPATNSFVFDLRGNPGLFLFVDPAVSNAELANTMAHELHHVGFAQNIPSPALAAEIAKLPPQRAALLNWIGAFGEGFAVLAAAGGPGVDPLTTIPSGARAAWREGIDTFPVQLAEVASFLTRVLDGSLDGEAARSAGMGFFAVQGPWYTVGWKMAVTIERRFGRARLIACIADQRHLLKTYNEATQRNGLPQWPAPLANAFSPEALS